MDYFNHNMTQKDRLTRRDFLKYAGLALGGLALSGTNTPGVLASLTGQNQDEPLTPDFPANIQLGRMCVGEPGTRVDILTEPYTSAPVAGTAWFDDVFEWKQEVISKQLDPIRVNQRWVEVPGGYIYADYLQKVKFLPQEPLLQLPETPNGERGMWVEIVAPYTSLTFERGPSQHWARTAVRPRIYYSQVFWAFAVRNDPLTGRPQYCLKQLYGADDDAYWVDAAVCRQITPEEVSTIHPDAEDKLIVVNLNYQTMTCYEGDEEVFFSKVTTGGYNYDDEKWLTPPGVHTIWRKMISTHMSAGPAVGNYDIPGVGWTTLFDNNGAAVHSTFWHNYYGTARSHGCVNAKPEDAQWVWRWTEPAVSYYPGELTIQGLNQSTKVDVVVA